MKHFLIEAFEILIYYTPKKAKDVMEADLIIKNPPYNERIKSVLK